VARRKGTFRFKAASLCIFKVAHHTAHSQSSWFNRQRAPARALLARRFLSGLVRRFGAQRYFKLFMLSLEMANGI